MKVYEIGAPDHYDDDSGCSDCTIWVASEQPIKPSADTSDKEYYVKELPYDADSPGVDFIIGESDTKDVKGDAMVRWEYQIVDDGREGNPDSVEDLNDLGNEGWELVAVVPQPLGNMKWYFKRQVKP